MLLKKKSITKQSVEVQFDQNHANHVKENTHAKKESYYMKKQREARCRSRADIEELIYHLKHDHRSMRNYLKGTAGDQINTYWLQLLTI